MKVTKKDSYSTLERIIHLSNGDTIEVVKSRKFGAPGWLPIFISNGDNNHLEIRNTSNYSDRADLDMYEEFAKGLLRAVKEARKLQEYDPDEEFKRMMEDTKKRLEGLTEI